MNDIEILEKYIKDKTIKSMGGLVTPDKEELQALENLINRVKELEEELEKEKRNNRWKENEQKELLKYKTIKIENSISKDKIKEKIEELEAVINEFYNSGGNLTISDEYQNKIDVLQELLEEQEDK